MTEQMQAAIHRAGLTVGQSADRLGCSPGTIYNLLRAGNLQSYTVGRCRRIVAESLDAYLEANIVTGLGRVDAA